MAKACKEGIVGRKTRDEGFGSMKLGRCEWLT